MSFKILSTLKKIDADALVKFNDETSVNFQNGKWNISVENPKDEIGILESYRKALDLAKEKGCNTVAMPFCKICNLRNSIGILKELTEEYDIEVFLFISKRELLISNKLYEDVKNYLHDNFSPKRLVDSQGPSLQENLSYPIRVEKSEEIYEAPTYRLDDILENLDIGFSETLLELIRESGKTEAEIYKKANISRKLFSKIRNNKEYRPSKRTAIAFALALELDLDETEDFLSRAGYALSHSKKFDVIVEYFIVNGNYDIIELNEVLFAFDQPLIGY